MNKIIFVVGHENWGKSKTLKCLTGNSRYIKNYELGAVNWFIRRMSNDDLPESYYDFMQKLDTKIKPYVIAAFCPNFDEERFDVTIELLNNLKNKGYKLYFWVLEQQFSTKLKMNPSYINQLRQFGTVDIYSDNEEADIRSLALSEFIIKHA